MLSLSLEFIFSKVRVRIEVHTNSFMMIPTYCISKLNTFITTPKWKTSVTAFNIFHKISAYTVPKSVFICHRAFLIIFLAFKGVRNRFIYVVSILLIYTVGHCQSTIHILFKTRISAINKPRKSPFDVYHFYIHDHPTNT